MAFDPVALKAVVRQLEISGAEIEELKTKLAHNQTSHKRSEPLIRRATGF